MKKLLENKLRLHRETLHALDAFRAVRGGIQDSLLCCEERNTKTCNVSLECTGNC